LTAGSAVDGKKKLGSCGLAELKIRGVWMDRAAEQKTSLMNMQAGKILKDKKD